MAQKDSFVFYRSFFEASKHLDTENKAALLDAIIEFALNHKQTELPPTAAGMFCLIKPQLEANYRKAVNGSKGGKYGKLGGRPKKEITPEKPLENPTGVIGENPIQTPNANVNANANVNENVNRPPEKIEFEYHQQGRIKGFPDKQIDVLYDKFYHWYSAKTNKDVTDWLSMWKYWLADKMPEKESGYQRQRSARPKRENLVETLRGANNG
jgi:hypothetical protein